MDADAAGYIAEQCDRLRDCDTKKNDRDVSKDTLDAALNLVQQFLTDVNRIASALERRNQI